MRKFLIKGLRKDPHISLTLAGNHRQQVERIFKDRGSCKILSADLTSASDLLPLDLCNAIVDGLVAAKEPGTARYFIPEQWHSHFRRLVGPQELHYPDGSVINSSRGILMGLPTTWIILCLV